MSIDGERGYRFCGRRAALTDIVTWLDRPVPDHRALVITGLPGVGKSAVLCRIVTTADATIRQQLPADDTGVKASPGSIGCAIHAKDKDALEVAREIAGAASIALPDRVEDLCPALRTDLETRDVSQRRFNIVIDALDEASATDQARRIIAGIIRPLTETCATTGVQVVVATGRHDAAGDLLHTFGRSAHIIDLDDPNYFTATDLYDYTLATLQLLGDERTGNPYADPEAAAPVVQRITDLAGRNFLVAGLVARAHGLHDTTPAPPGQITFIPTVDHALNQYLDRTAPVGRIPARLALTVLAHAQAPGLPVELWRTGLAAWGQETTDDQLRQFTHRAAANYLIETSTPETSRTYRLFHQALNDVLRTTRARVHDPSTELRALTRAWIHHGRQNGWANAPTYLLHNLPNHAHAAGLINDLLTDDTYLLHADLRRLTPLAGSPADPIANQRARMLRLTPQAITATPADRAAMFNLTTTIDHLHPYPPHPEAPYHGAWASVRPRREHITLEGHTGGVRGVCAVEVDGRQLLASASDDRTVRVWDLAAGELRVILEGHTGGVNRVCVAEVDGCQLLASVSDDGTVRVWDLAAGELRVILEGHTDWVWGVCAVEVDGRQLLASASDDGTVRVWDLAAGELRVILEGHTNRVRGVCAVEVDGRQFLASASDDRTVRVWDPVSGELRVTLEGHSDWVRGVCVVEVDGCQLLASASDDETVRVWDPATGELRVILEGHTGGVNGVCAVEVDGRQLLASASDDETVRVWDPATGDLCTPLDGHSDWVNGVCAVEVDGCQLLASASDDETVRVWELATGELRVILDGHSDWVNGVCAVEVDGCQLLASVSNDRTVRVWDPVAGELRVILEGHTNRVRGVCVVEVDGRQLLASASDDRTVRVWDLAAGELRVILEGHTGGVHRVCAVEVDGRQFLASASDDRTVRVWDPVAGELRVILEGHTNRVRGVCVVEVDGRQLLASASDDRTVRVWDLAAGELCTTLEGHTGGVNGVCAVEVDGRQLLASASDDRTVRVWDPVTGRTDVAIHTHGHAISCAYINAYLSIATSAGLLAVQLRQNARNDIHESR